MFESQENRRANGQTTKVINFFYPRYAEAHVVQQTIIEMEKKEKEIFQKQRQTKIETALSTLVAKQKTEKEALLKKTKAT
jgi:hypothetical protein